MSGRITWDTAVAVAAMRQAAVRGVNDAAEHILEEANRTVPFEEGTLQDSGQVAPATAANLKATVSYDTPYAVRQHEDTRLRHDAGQEAKWLERTLQRRATAVREFLSASLRRALT